MDIRLTLESDATFGQGSGHVGIVDNEVQHDPETGLPFLRGRTLKGLLVEECSTLLYAVEQQTNGRPSDLEAAAQFLFGKPGSKSGTAAVMNIGRARLPSDLRQAIAADVKAGRLAPPDVLDALTTIRRQTAISDETGAPVPGSLRASRVIFRETSFRARLRFRQNPTPNALALLAACVLALRRAGTRRNRGRGALKARLVENGVDVTDEHYDRFRSLARPSASVPEPEAGAAESSSNTTYTARPEAESGFDPTGGEPPSADPVVLTYQIRLQQPTLVTSVEGDSNSAVSYNYLPGSSLRGALIGKFRRQKRASNEDFATDAAARRLFFDGDVRFLNGYPLDPVRQAGRYGTDVRMWPTPLSYHHAKGEPGPVRDFAASFPSPGDQTQWKNVGQPFAAMGDRELNFFQPDRHVAVHNQRDRKKGRATRESGEFFRYDALAPGQTFEAAIWCPSAACADELAPLLEGTLTLGRSGSVDYGLVRIEEKHRQQADSWHELGDDPPRPRDDGTVVVMLLSNALVRDRQGQFTASIETVADSMRDRLDLNDIDVVQSFVRTEVVGGFNRKWGLPLPQALSLRMGSVVKLQISDFSPKDSSAIERKLARLEREGIGQRRAEGFGRVAVNRHILDGPRRVRRKTESTSPDSRSIEDEASLEIAETMTERMLRKQLDVALVKHVNALASGIGSPSNSQLARLRSAFRSAIDRPPEEGRAYLRDVLDGLPQSSRRQLTHDQIGNRGRVLLKWLKRRVEDDEEIWKRLDVSPRDLPQIGDVQATLSDELAYEYNLRLAHDTLARAAKLGD
ncbi:MAG: RAMP superfamily CRISPR-associated protein [Salinibacter sp.]